MGLLEGFFVPLHCYYLTPTTEQHMVHNVNLAFELMDEAGLPRPRARPEGNLTRPCRHVTAPHRGLYLIRSTAHCCTADVRFLDIVKGDLKATLRVLYNLFTRYKNIS